jgi:hypothetical protein
MQEYFADLDFAAPLGKNRDIQFHSVSTHDGKHGRIEDRDYAVSDDVGRLIERRPDWKDDPFDLFSSCTPPRMIRHLNHRPGVFPPKPVSVRYISSASSTTFRIRRAVQPPTYSSGQ